MKKLTSTLFVFGLTTSSVVFSEVDWISRDCTKKPGAQVLVHSYDVGPICSVVRKRTKKGFWNFYTEAKTQCEADGGKLVEEGPPVIEPAQGCGTGFPTYDVRMVEYFRCDCSADYDAANRHCASQGQGIVSNAYTGRYRNEQIEDICLADFSGAKPSAKVKCSEHHAALRGLDRPTLNRCLFSCEAWMDKFCQDVPGVRACVERWFDPVVQRDPHWGGEPGGFWKYYVAGKLDPSAADMCWDLIGRHCQSYPPDSDFSQKFCGHLGAGQAPRVEPSPIPTTMATSIPTHTPTLAPTSIPMPIPIPTASDDEGMRDTDFRDARMP